MSNGNERKWASEAHTFLTHPSIKPIVSLNRRKTQDGQRCPRCNVFIPPHGNGVADYNTYFIDLLKNGDPSIPISIECKATYPDKLAFSTQQWREDQREWMSQWQNYTGRTGWIWLHFGQNDPRSKLEKHWTVKKYPYGDVLTTEKRDVKTPRRVYLIPFDIFHSHVIFIESEFEKMDANASGSRKSHAYIAYGLYPRMRNRKFIEEYGYTMTAVLDSYRMDWYGDGYWFPHDNHIFWSIYSDATSTAIPFSKPQAVNEQFTVDL